MPDGRNTTDGLARVGPDEVRRGALQPNAVVGADLRQIDAVGTAGHDQPRLAGVRGEDQRVGDRADLAAELVGGGLGRRRGSLEDPDPPGHAGRLEHGVDRPAARMQMLHRFPLSDAHERTRLHDGSRVQVDRGGG